MHPHHAHGGLQASLPGAGAGVSGGGCWRRGISMVCLLFASLMVARADRRVTLSWDVAVDSNVVNCVVQYGVRSRMYSRTLQTGARTNITINGLKDGVTYYFSVKAVNRFGAESDPSDEMVFADPCAGRAFNLAITPIVVGPNLIKLALESLPNRKYEIQATDDLQSWSVLGGSPITTANGIFEVLDPRFAPTSRRFYRAVMAGPFIEYPGALEITPALSPSAGNHARFTAAAGRAYEIQSSTNSRAWTTLWSSALNVSGGNVEVQDPSPNAAVKRYRLMGVSDPVAAHGAACGTSRTRFPSISTPAPQQTYLNIPTAPIALTVLDADTPSSALRLSASSSNPSLIKESAIEFDGSAASRTVIVTPARGQSGTTIIELIVSDGANATATAFELEVLPFTPVAFPIVVRQHGDGTITPDLDGRLLTPGVTYSMTAKPAPGQIFAGWTGSATSAAPRLTFVMQSNFSVDAWFLANPFPAIAGAYSGLFREEEEFQQEHSGGFTAAVGSSGRYSGKLTLAGRTHSFSGQLDSNLTATNLIVRKGASSLTIELAFGGAHSDQVTGRLLNEAWQVPLAGHRSVHHSKNAPSPLAGAFTFLLPGQTNPTDGPEGYGHGVIKIDGNGMAAFAGTLADGTKFTRRAPLSERGRWPFYSSLYGGSGGVSGWLTVTNQSTNHVRGGVDWTKPVQLRAKLHPAGFTNLTSVLGSRYTRPVTTTNRVLNLPQASVTFSGGDLAGSFTADILWSEKNKLSDAGTNQLSISLSTSSGLFHGTVIHLASGKRASFSGAVLQTRNLAAGFLPGTNRSARVLITSPVAGR